MTTILKKSIAIVVASATIVAACAIPASAGWKGKGGGHHGGHGGALAAGVFGALALGMIASAASAAPTECVLEKRRVYNAYGEFVGVKTIRVCD